MSRKLPIYLLLDISHSMSGEPIEAVRQGVDLLHSALLQDPYALETAYLSIITFGSTANQITPLTDIPSFTPPHIDTDGTTEMGAALKLVADCIEREVTQGSAEVRGDWKPIIFLMTDGSPTDDLNAGIARLNQVKTGNVICCAAGPNADTNTLKSISEVVVHLDTADTNSIAAFFKWVSASVSHTSKKIDLTKSDDGGVEDLPPPPAEVKLV